MNATNLLRDLFVFSKADRFGVKEFVADHSCGDLTGGFDALESCKNACLQKDRPMPFGKCQREIDFLRL